MKAGNDYVRSQLAKARTEADLGKRAQLLVDLLRSHPGFASQAFAGLEWCGPDALPALRGHLKVELIGRPVVRGIHETMSKIGPAARADLFAVCNRELKHITAHGVRIRFAGGIEDLQAEAYENVMAALFNPDAFKGLPDAEQKALRAHHAFIVAHEVLPKVGEKGDRLHDRLDRALVAK